jgi:Domain of unknown function (DUF4279)
MTYDPDSGEESRELIRVGGPVDETSATLRILGDDLDPDEITQILGFPPTVARRKGDIRIGKRTKNEYKARTGQWHLESPRGKGYLDNHIRWILDALCPEQDPWDSIKARYDLDLFCGLFLDDWNRGTGISADHMYELGRRGIALSLDIYSHTPDDDET